MITFQLMAFGFVLGLCWYMDRLLDQRRRERRAFERRNRDRIEKSAIDRPLKEKP